MLVFCVRIEKNVMNEVVVIRYREKIILCMGMTHSVSRYK